MTQLQLVVGWPGGSSTPNATPLPASSGSRQRVVLTVGLPGSGKSTWLANRNLPAISTDQIRSLLADDPTNQNIHGRVFATVRYILRQRLAIGRPITYIDATHISKAERRPYLVLSKWYAFNIEILYFNTPLEICLERNALRERVVPPEAIVAMAARLKVPELAEGFIRVTEVLPSGGPAQNPGLE